MTEETFSIILGQFNEIRDYVKVLVLYHGGEPLLNSRLTEMVLTCRNALDLEKIKVVTNGVLLTEDKARSLIDAGVTEFEVSVDGSSSEENEKIRIGVDSQQVLENLGRLLQIANESSVQVKVSNTTFLNNSEVQNLVSTSENWVREWLQTHLGKPVDVKPVTAVRWPSMGDRGLLQVAPLESLPKSGMICEHTVETITVRWDGTVVPCCYDLVSDLPMGNVHEKSLLQIWNGTAYRRLREEIFQGTPPHPCNTCAVLVGGQQLSWKESEVSLRLSRPKRSELQNITRLEAPSQEFND